MWVRGQFFGNQTQEDMIELQRLRIMEQWCGWGYCNRTIKTKVIEASTLRTILGQATSRESDYYGPQVKVRLDPSSPTTLLVAVRFPGV